MRRQGQTDLTADSIGCSKAESQTAAEQTEDITQTDTDTVAYETLSRALEMEQMIPGLWDIALKDMSARAFWRFGEQVELEMYLKEFEDDIFGYYGELVLDRESRMYLELTAVKGGTEGEIQYSLVSKEEYFAVEGLFNFASGPGLTICGLMEVENPEEYPQPFREEIKRSLCGAVLSYAGKCHQNHTGSIEGTMTGKFYLFYSDTDEADNYRLFEAWWCPDGGEPIKMTIERHLEKFDVREVDEGDIFSEEKAEMAMVTFRYEVTTERR